MVKPKQTCSTCPHAKKCWGLRTNSGKPISAQNITINILICRLQLGIQRDMAAKNLIQLYRPGMLRLLSHAKQQGNIVDMEVNTILQDMQSTMIEYLAYDYKIGDRGRATPYLFDPQQGFLTKWIKWTVGKNRRFYMHHELFSPNDDENDSDDGTSEPEYAQHATQGRTQDSWSAVMDGGGSLRYDPYTQDNDISHLSKQVTEIIEDGITLNSNEYRVMQFCLSNGNESNNTRLIDGLHIILSKLMGVSRPRITRLYARAKSKLIAKYAQTQEEIDI
jgi:hypothetical protein